MNYSQAKAKALHLTAERKTDHVLFGTHEKCHYAMANYWNGEIIETISYVPEAEKNTDKPKKSNQSRKNSDNSEDKSEEI
jgi:hypothetical protein